MENIVKKFEASIQQLRTLLNQENACLKSGNFIDVKDITDKKIEALRNLRPWLEGKRLLSEEAKSLSDIQVLSVRNGMLLKAAINGAKSAADRLASLQTATSSIGAYDRNGRSLHIEYDAIKNTKVM